MPRSQIIDVATQSLANPYGLSTLPPELYVPLWLYSGGATANTAGGGSSSTPNLVTKGNVTTTAYNATPSNYPTSVKLFTLNSNWQASTKCALELALWNNNGGTSYAAIFDFTANAIVSGSTVSTLSSTYTVLRSGQFTLVPGRTYGIAVWAIGTSTVASLTDASLIIFPTQQLLTQGSLANITLGTVGQKLTEAQIPLWVYSSGTASGTNTAVGYYLQKGATSATTSTTSQIKLHTLSSSWNLTQKFALEMSLYVANSAATVNAYLVDTSNGYTVVSGASVSTSSTTATLVRSGSFTLVPGHTYAIEVQTTNASYAWNVTKAHLVPLFT